MYMYQNYAKECQSVQFMLFRLKCKTYIYGGWTPLFLQIEGKQGDGL